MNKPNAILCHIKENKAFYLILVLNCVISFGFLYFAQNYDLIENRIEIQEDININHQEADSLCADIQYKSNWYLSTTSGRLALHGIFHNREWFLSSCTGLKIYPDMTYNSISSFLKMKIVSEFPKKMKNQIRV